MCLAQGYNAVTPVRLEPVALWSPVKHSTTEPLHSLHADGTDWNFFENINSVKNQITKNLESYPACKKINIH